MRHPFYENFRRFCPKSAPHFEQPGLSATFSLATNKPPGKKRVVMFFLMRMASRASSALLPSGTKLRHQMRRSTRHKPLRWRVLPYPMRGFCERQPDACVTGGRVAVALGHKAEAGARTLYDFVVKLRDKSASTEKANTKFVPGSEASQGTLSPADITPAWHAPVPLPPRREARDGRPAA